MTELKENTTGMLNHIINDVMSDHIHLPSKLPFIVPQPFDKLPYVALSNGKKLYIDSMDPTLFSSQYLEATKDNRNFVLSKESRKLLSNQSIDDGDDDDSKDQNVVKRPVHAYTLKFWPLTTPAKLQDTSTFLHDKYVNNFDVIANNSIMLACEVCHHRFRVIQCKTCMKGYCFFCAHRVHNKAFKRYHSMTIMEPRIIQYKKIESSLIYHIDVSASVVHDLSYLIKYLRSAGEVARIQRERKLLKEYEKQEEEKRIAYLKAMAESECVVDEWHHYHHHHHYHYNHYHHHHHHFCCI